VGARARKGTEVVKDSGDTEQGASGHSSGSADINEQISDELDRYAEQKDLTTHGGYPHVWEASIHGRLMEHTELDAAQETYTEETPDDVD
jgi:hypothetical protein